MEKKPDVRKNVKKSSKGRFNPKRKGIAPGEEKEVHKQSHNDSSWYMSDSQLVNDVASISFNTALGNPLTLRGSLGISFNVGDASVNLPGIMSIYTTPTIGVSKDANSPVNIAMRRLYSYVRHTNSGHSNYEPADLMLYLLAMDSIYTYWAYMVRAYGVAQVFSRTNKYVGDALLTAMGVDPNIRESLADFRAYINTFAAKAQQWCVPRVMTYFLRHNWMYSNVYKDEDNDKAQMFMYVPACVYKYNPTLSEGTAGGLEPMLVAAEISNTDAKYFSYKTIPNSYVNLVAIGNSLLNALAGQEDIGIISGDILKAYGAENLWKIDTIPADYQVIPVFSEEVLEQFHNTAFASTILVNSSGENLGAVGLNVTQDTSIGGGCLQFNPIFNYGSHLCMDTLMDTWKMQVTPESIMTASRNMLAGVPFQPTPGSKSLIHAVTLRSCGSELCLFAVIHTINGNVLNRERVYAGDTYVPDAFVLPRFNEAPIRPVMNSAGTAMTNIYGELTNYGVLSKQNIDQIHEVALMSLFGVPFLK